MVSRKNFIPARLYLVLIFAFTSTGNAQIPSSTLKNNSKISITDFKFYRRITYNGQQILLNNRPKVKKIIYLSNQLSQSVSIINNKKSFSLEGKNKKYEISLSKNKIDYSSVQKSVRCV